jgi:hypothetical protein
LRKRDKIYKEKLLLLLLIIMSKKIKAVDIATEETVEEKPIEETVVEPEPIVEQAKEEEKGPQIELIGLHVFKTLNELSAFLSFVYEEDGKNKGVWSNSRQAALFVFPDGQWGKEGFKTFIKTKQHRI